MLNSLVVLLRSIFSPLWRWGQRRRSRHRAKAFVEELSTEQKQQLRIAHRLAGESSSRMFSEVVTGGGGLDNAEYFLYPLIEEEAIVRKRREEREDGGFAQLYRFDGWFYDYLADHPETLTQSEDGCE